MSDPKQEIFDILYQFKGGESVLDVGCGEINPLLNVREYEGIDLKFGVDWYDYQPGQYDVIIANDLFPNVDQRLELFLEKYLPRCKEMRLSLAYFDEPKWYRAKRIDGDEILTMEAWDEYKIFKALGDKLDPLMRNARRFQGTFPNGRRVLLVWLKGGLA